MTTMPPEMSTATASPTVALPASSVPRDPSVLTSLQSSRSRFMITDILAGGAAAALQNGNRSPPIHQSTGPAFQPHHHQHQQHNSALQHYLAQQQHLLQQHQQHQQQQQQQHHHNLHQQQHHNPLLSHSLRPHPPHHQQPNPHQQAPSPSSHSSSSTHPSLGHLPPSGLIGFPTSATAVHYAALHHHQHQHQHLLHQQQERDQRLRDLDSRSSSLGASLDHDDRSQSHSPPVRDLTGGSDGAGRAHHQPHNISIDSVNDEQASTIDDSDSDTCGAKDDDGDSSIKSDHNNLMGGLSKKQRKARTAFTDHQLQTLEKSFERQKYLSVQDRMELANKLELSDCQVKTWYQNRRTKWKRQTAVGLELLAEASNYAAFQRLYGGGSPYLSAWPYAAAAAAAQTPHGAAASSATAIDLYYRQAAAAAALQKPISYRMYPRVVPPMGAMACPPHGSHGLSPHPLSASTSLSSLGGYYQPLNSNNSGHNSNMVNLPPSASAHALPSPDVSDASDKHRRSVELVRSPSPQLNPGSPPERGEARISCTPSSQGDDETVDGVKRGNTSQKDESVDGNVEDDDAIEV